jgi:hypothetical protein
LAAASSPPASPSFTLATGGKARTRRCDACGIDPAVEYGVLRRATGATIAGRFCRFCIDTAVRNGAIFESGLRRIG